MTEGLLLNSVKFRFNTNSLRGEIMKVGDIITINNRECEITLMLENYTYAQSVKVHESYHCSCGGSLAVDKRVSVDGGKTFSFLGEACSSCGDYI